MGFWKEFFSTDTPNSSLEMIPTPNGMAIRIKTEHFPSLEIKPKPQIENNRRELILKDG